MLHRPVLLDAVINGLAIKPDGVYVDGTFGRGGHSRVILDALGEKGRLIVLDKDDTAIDYAKEHFSSDPRITIVKSSFAETKDVLDRLGYSGKVNGILLDLGVSSPQLDDPSRGFSFMKDGPLDMRMDRTSPLSAESFINHASVEEMVDVFRTYGEERYAKRIAAAIVREREVTPITTTLRLAEIVKTAHPNWERHKHPATRVFQAIRIYVNRELDSLVTVLNDSLYFLAVGGRLAVISFHSLEDRIVKQFMQEQAKGPYIPKEIPIRDCDIKRRFKLVTKAVKATEEEVALNIRSRSAVLRIGEKIA